jgi:acyl-coenzyme A synthetase/AMP-(fatty) acid ligase
VLPAAQRPAPGARANLFGMTETFGPYCGAPLDRDLPPSKHGSCGQPFAGFEVRIADPVSGQPSAPGAVGEIRLRGRNMMRALCGRTADAVFDADGFYPTGDLGALDGDGYLWYHGRLDDMFKVSGATVYPAEVEAALRRVPGVQQAHVTDVATDDGTAEVGALVVSDQPLEQLVAGARARLSAFKVPTRWVVTGSGADVPLTATSKVDRDALQALLKEGTPT